MPGGSSRRCGNRGCTAETLRKWVRQAERNAGKRAGLTTEERERLKALERENRELRRANKILRLAEAGIEPSVGRKGDSYDNALAGCVIGLFKTEVIRRQGTRRNKEDVEFATLKWVWWFNYHRLLEPIGHVPPDEYEEAYNQVQEGSIGEAGLKETSLRRTAKMGYSENPPASNLPIN